MRLFRPHQKLAHGEHRAATPLELLFDLATVIAIATAAAGFHHGLAEGHIVQGLISFIMAFFMIWWSWMNYTWFASSFDDRSAFFRVMTLIALFGALTIAAGIPAVYAGQPIYTCLIGFVIMRAAMAALWFWAPHENAAQRFSSHTYGWGILAMQAFWIAAVLLTPVSAPYYIWLFIAGVIGELSVPVLAEFRGEGTGWHRGHIIERYGLVTIIVLGECFLSIVGFLRQTAEQLSPTPEAMLHAVSCAVITFCMYGYYFHWGTHLPEGHLRRALQWGYGHFFVFASAACTGVGFAVLRETLGGDAHVDLFTAELSVSIPVALFILSTWLVRDRFEMGERRCFVPVCLAFVIGATPLVMPKAHFLISGILLATVAILALPKNNGKKELLESQG
ncbi:MAG: low temperature requirement protein A [Chthonomonas sp.]|nr:low temperature requirement protein A [Chthonomonas sp.]